MVKSIEKFWPVALMNHPMIGMHAQHASDQAALSYLEYVWLVRDATESRCFTLEFVSAAFFFVAPLGEGARRWNVGDSVG